MNPLQRFFRQLLPYLILGFIIAFAIGLFILFYYALIWGIVLGCMIWLVVSIKNSLFLRRPLKKKTGRIIEHDDRK